MLFPCSTVFIIFSLDFFRTGVTIPGEVSTVQHRVYKHFRGEGTDVNQSIKGTDITREVWYTVTESILKKWKYENQISLLRSELTQNIIYVDFNIKVTVRQRRGLYIGFIQAWGDTWYHSGVSFILHTVYFGTNQHVIHWFRVRTLQRNLYKAFSSHVKILDDAVGIVP